MVYTHLAAAILAAALAGWCAWTVQAWRLGEQIATIKASQLEAVNTATREARATESRRYQEVHDAQANATKRAQVARNDAAAARTELDRLRDAIRTRAVCLPGDTAGSGAVGADTAGELQLECSAALVELARKADAHAGDALMLQSAWPR